MLEKFIYEITKPAVNGDGNAFNKELEKTLNTTNIKRNIKKIDNKFWIDIELASQEIVNALQKDPTETNKILEKWINNYKKYREIRKDGRFLDAQKTFEIIKDNLWRIQGIIQETNSRINTLLIQNPGIEDKKEIFKKILENSDIQSGEIEVENEYIKAIYKIIIKKNIDEEEKISQIKEWYKSSKGRKNISRTEFYKELGLDEELGNNSDEKGLLIGNFIKQIDLPLIKLLVNKKINNNKENNKELNENINNRLRELEVPENILKSIELRQLWNNTLMVKGTIDLGKIEKKEKNKHENKFVYSTKEKEWEKTQTETTDINSIVGEQMNREVFLGAAAIIKDEEFDKELIEELIEDKKEIPAQYSNKSPKGVYYFTIWREKRGIHNPLINVGILENNIPKGIRIEEKKIYKIQITGIKKETERDERKQSYIIYGKVISDNNEDE